MRDDDRVKDVPRSVGHGLAANHCDLRIQMAQSIELADGANLLFKCLHDEALGFSKKRDVDALSRNELLPSLRQFPLVSLHTSTRGVAEYAGDDCCRERSCDVDDFRGDTLNGNGRAK